MGASSFVAGSRNTSRRYAQTGRVHVGELGEALKDDKNSVYLIKSTIDGVTMSYNT